MTQSFVFLLIFPLEVEKKSKGVQVKVSVMEDSGEVRKMPGYETPIKVGIGSGQGPVDVAVFHDPSGQFLVDIFGCELGEVALREETVLGVHLPDLVALWESLVGENKTDLVLDLEVLVRRHEGDFEEACGSWIETRSFAVRPQQ